MEGKAWGDQVAVGVSCYGDSICKECGVTWLLLRSLDDTREMKSYEYTYGTKDSFEGILYLL